MNRLLQHWRALSGRERAVVTVGVAAALVIVLYAYVWVPWHLRLAGLRQQVPAQRQTLAWMQRTAREIRPYLQRKRHGGGRGNISVLTVIDNSANATGLRDTIKQIQPNDNAEVKVWFQDVAFDQWLRWIAQLQEKDVYVSNASVSRSQKPDTVNVTVTLKADE